MIEIKGVQHSGNFDLGGEYINDHSPRCRENEPLVLVRGKNYAGYFIGFVPPDRQARQVYQGPLVPGPWAYISPHSSVMDNCGGTGAVIRRARDRGLVYEVGVGDTVSVEGVAFKIETASHWDNVNLRLTRLGVETCQTK